jgi:hypothetical protein
VANLLGRKHTYQMRRTDKTALTTATSTKPQSSFTSLPAPPAALSSGPSTGVRDASLWTLACCPPVRPASTSLCCAGTETDSCADSCPRLSCASAGLSPGPPSCCSADCRSLPSVNRSGPAGDRTATPTGEVGSSASPRRARRPWFSRCRHSACASADARRCRRASASLRASLCLQHAAELDGVVAARC